MRDTRRSHLNGEIVGGRVPIDDMTGWHDVLRRGLRNSNFSYKEWEKFSIDQFLANIHEHFKEKMTEEECYASVALDFKKGTGETPAEANYETEIRSYIHSAYESLIKFYQKEN